MPVATNDQRLDLASISSPSGGTTRRVEQPDQLGEGLLLAVVRGGAGQDQSLGAAPAAGEPVVLGRGVGDVVGLVDDDRVPVLLLQVRAVAVVLQRVDGDDHPLEEGERVAVGRELLPDPLDPGGVEPDEREREAGPQLVLHLLEDVLRGDDQDAFTAAAPDQLGQDHADLEGLAEADGVGEQDPRAEVLGVERLAQAVSW